MTGAGRANRMRGFMLVYAKRAIERAWLWIGNKEIDLRMADVTAPNHR